MTKIFNKCKSNPKLLYSVFFDVARKSTPLQKEICETENIICCAKTFTSDVGISSGNVTIKN